MDARGELQSARAHLERVAAAGVLAESLNGPGRVRMDERIAVQGWATDVGRW